ncbi:MAG: cytochrome c oxidase subunit II, partial [Saccharolobus sp.]
MEKARIFELSTIVFAIVILTVLGVFSD